MKHHFVWFAVALGLSVSLGACKRQGNGPEPVTAETDSPQVAPVKPAETAPVDLSRSPSNLIANNPALSRALMGVWQVPGTEDIGEDRTGNF